MKRRLQRVGPLDVSETDDVIRARAECLDLVATDRQGAGLSWLRAFCRSLTMLLLLVIPLNLLTIWSFGSGPCTI